MFFDNGEYYFGEWKNNYMHGKGIYFHNDFSLYKGYFEFGKKCGKGVEFYFDYSYYKGNFKDNLKHGKGVKVLDRQNVYNEFWNKGSLIKSEISFKKIKIFQDFLQNKKIVLQNKN